MVQTNFLDSPTVDLTGAGKRVLDFMSDHAWHSLDEISRAAMCSPTGASARIRDLRKARYGGHSVECRQVSVSVFQYRLKGTKHENR